MRNASKLDTCQAFINSIAGDVRINLLHSFQTYVSQNIIIEKREQYKIVTVQQILSARTSNFGICHPIETKNTRKSFPQLSWLSCIILASQQPIAIFLDSIDSVALPLLFHPGQSIGGKLRAPVTFFKNS